MKVNLVTAKDIGSFKIALVISRFNEDITTPLSDGALKRLQELEFNPEDVTVVRVPGAVEIPYVAQQLAKQKKYKAIVALGAVIRGETSHYDVVCQQVSYGCQKVSLEHDIPVAFGVLTTDTLNQALERVGGKKGHIARSAIDVAVEMASKTDVMNNSST